MSISKQHHKERALCLNVVCNFQDTLTIQGRQKLLEKVVGPTSSHEENCNDCNDILLQFASGFVLFSRKQQYTNNNILIFPYFKPI